MALLWHNYNIRSHLVQRSTSRVIAESNNEQNANELVNVLECMYGVIDIIENK